MRKSPRGVYLVPGAVLFSYQFQSVLIAPVLEGVLVTSKARPLSVPCFISCHLFARPEKRQNYFGRLRTQSDWLRSRHTCRQLHENRLRGNFPSRTRRASPCLAPFLRVAQWRFQVPTQRLHAFFFPYKSRPKVLSYCCWKEDFLPRRLLTSCCRCDVRKEVSPFRCSFSGSFSSPLVDTLTTFQLISAFKADNPVLSKQ